MSFPGTASPSPLFALKSDEKDIEKLKQKIEVLRREHAAILTAATEKSNAERQAELKKECFKKHAELMAAKLEVAELTTKDETELLNSKLAFHNAQLIVATLEAKHDEVARLEKSIDLEKQQLVEAHKEKIALLASSLENVEGKEEKEILRSQISLYEAQRAFTQLKMDKAEHAKKRAKEKKDETEIKTHQAENERLKNEFDRLVELIFAKEERLKSLSPDFASDSRCWSRTGTQTPQVRHLDGESRADSRATSAGQTPQVIVSSPLVGGGKVPPRSRSVSAHGRGKPIEPARSYSVSQRAKVSSPNEEADALNPESPRGEFGHVSLVPSARSSIISVEPEVLAHFSIRTRSNSGASLESGSLPVTPKQLFFADKESKTPSRSATPAEGDTPLADRVALKNGFHTPQPPSHSAIRKNSW